MSSTLQCYNKGCLQKFNPDENTETSCIFHPGVPVFHDVYKSWSCCKKKTTDFTEFLNIKGCEKGRHNPEKPPEPDVPKSDNNKKDEVVVVTAPRPPSSAPRLNDDHPKKKLIVKIAPSLETHLTQLKQAESVNGAESEAKSNVENATEVVVGTQCQRAGCAKTYENKLSNDEVCWFHSGVPVFHEGMKYWSCCERKTSDFENFLQQSGCTSGKHCWTKEGAGKKALAACRYDWHQTANDVYITIYSKYPSPDDTLIVANAVNVTAHVEYENGNNVFDLDVPLWGAVDTDKSLVTMSAAKVEIKMKKSDLVSWPKLIYQPPLSCSSERKIEDLKLE